MQFGKVSGLGLIILGILLCLFQFTQWALSQKLASPPDQSSAAPHQKVSPVPGLVGAGLVIVGIALLATARRRDEPPPQHAVK